uniref:Uncharacterized protein n=1 Tax=Kalanchoe fedtschenkoi TaxID=63787 RepID=A0A7N0TEZ7_KALFE
MGGKRRQQRRSSSSGFSLFGFLKSRKPEKFYEESWDEAVAPNKIWPSDEDKYRWVADPRINIKATAFIDRFKSRVSESEHQTVAAYPSGY